MRWEDECKSLIDDGICHADCCGIVPYPEGFYRTHLQATKCVCRVVPGGLYEWIIGPDETCVFVNPGDFLCNVYDDRPRLCRIFGASEEFYLRCPWLKPDGSRRTRSERRRFHRDMRSEMNHTFIATRMR